jgi:hypothetical protein
MVNTNSKEYESYWNMVDSKGGMAIMSIPPPNTGVINDLWWVNPNDYSQGLTGTNPNKKMAVEEKKFLWMPRKYGIPVAIIGTLALIYFGYKKIGK